MQREVRWFPTRPSRLPESKIHFGHANMYHNFYTKHIPCFLLWETLLVSSASANVPLQFCMVQTGGKRKLSETSENGKPWRITVSKRKCTQEMVPKPCCAASDAARSCNGRAIQRAVSLPGEGKKRLCRLAAWSLGRFMAAELCVCARAVPTCAAG